MGIQPLHLEQRDFVFQPDLEPRQNIVQARAELFQPAADRLVGLEVTAFECHNGGFDLPQCFLYLSLDLGKPVG